MSRGAVAGVVGGVLAVSAFGIGDAIASASSHGAHHSTSGSAAQVAAATKKGTRHYLKRHGHLFFGPRGMLGGGRMLGRGGMLGPGGLLGRVVLGKVSAIGTGTVTVVTREHGAKVLDTTSSTRYYTMLQKATSSALAVNDEVAVLVAGPRVRLGAATPAPVVTKGTPKAAAIVVLEPSAVGTVVSSSPSEIVVKDLTGLERDIVVNGSTSYSEAGTTITPAAVTKGEQVFAYGTAASDATKLDATNVTVVGPRVAGIVKSISGDTVTLRRPGGTETVTTTSSTIFRDRGAASSLSAIKKGDILFAIGDSTGSNAVTASAVVFSPFGSRAGLRGRPWSGAPAPVASALAAEPDPDPS